jgi:hypothetical protein
MAYLRHRKRSAIGGDLVVENGKAGLKVGNPAADRSAMPGQQGAAVRHCCGIAAHACISLHVAQPHSRGLQASEKVDPGEDRGVVVTMPRLIASCIGQKPDPLIIADGVR